jgi:hypothetical protein
MIDLRLIAALGGRSPKRGAHRIEVVRVKPPEQVRERGFRTAI